MSDASRRNSSSKQVNFTLDPHWYLVLRILAEVEGTSVPDLLRPVVMRYLRRRMRDEDVREAVARIENARRVQRGIPDNITPMSTPARGGSTQRASTRRRSRPNEPSAH